MLKAYPDLADGLQSYFEGEAMIGDLAVATSKQSPLPASGQVPADLRETVRPGAMESDTSSGFAPRNFGRYQLLRPLGEGAMESVYLACDTLLERKVALKVPKTEGTSNAEFMARFTREAKAAAGLKHPNICSVFDAGEHNGTAYITMDFIDGVPLSRFIGSSKLKSLDAILKMLSTIAEAVGHAHSKGVILFERFNSLVWDYPVNAKAKAPPIADDDFQAIAPFNTARAKKYQNACAAHLKLPVEYTNSIGMEFRLIPPGTFTIGSSPEQIAAAKPQLHTSYESNRPERADSEGPRRVVTLTRPFYLGATEVTQSQFLQVVGANPSVYSPTGEASEKVGQTDRSNSPAENMSWLATGEFCNRLSAHEKLDSAYTITPQLITQTGTGGYRLPTEAEWEFACRAGTTLQFWCGLNLE